VSRDGATAYVSNFNDGSVQVIDVASGARVRYLHVAPQNAYRLALSPDDARLYVTSTDGNLYAVDLTERDSTRSVRLGGGLHGLAIGRDGGTLVVSGANGHVWRVDACTLAVRASATLRSSASQEVALAPDETEVYVADERGAVDVLDAATLAPLRRLILRGLAPFGLAVTPDGAELYVASAGTGHVAIVDSRSGEVVHRYRVGGTPRRIAFDVAGASAVVSNEGNWFDVIR
jgi:YVTN family beta-propeller protein